MMEIDTAIMEKVVAYRSARLMLDAAEDKVHATRQQYFDAEKERVDRQDLLDRAYASMMAVIIIGTGPITEVQR